MKKVYFVSDAHLRIGDESSQSEKKLLELFETVKSDASHLYIVGDLFDFWFEYKYAIPAAYLRVLASLLELTKSGVKVFYIPGNHDFWMRDYLKRQVGIELTGDTCETTLFGKRILVTHGDGLRKDDVGYRIIKKIFRNKICIWLYSQLPVNIGYRLASGTSHASRKYTNSRNKKDPTDYIAFAQGMVGNGFDAVVMGHLHVPQIVPIGKGSYVNCGDFFEHFSYVLLDESGFHLKSI